MPLGTAVLTAVKSLLGEPGLGESGPPSSDSVAITRVLRLPLQRITIDRF